MAITTNTFNVIKCLPFSDTAWTSLMSPPTLSAGYMAAILVPADMFCFVLAGGDPFTILTVEGGIATLPAAVVDTESVQTSVTITDSNGVRSDLARSVSGSALYWRTNSSMWTYDATAIADINSITT